MVVKKTNLGTKIFKKRKELNLSLQDLANKLGVSKATVFNWEKDKMKPYGINLEKILEFLGKIESENDNVNLKIVSGFRNDKLNYVSDGIDLIYQQIQILELNGEVKGLTKDEIEEQFFVWIDKTDKYIVKKLSDYEGGTNYLIFEDYELKRVELSEGKLKDKSSNFVIVGKLLKLIKELD